MKLISNFKFPFGLAQGGQISNFRGFILHTSRLIKSEGFTLIELIVVFSVIAILSTIGVASFVSYSRAQTLQQATNDFINILNTAKARSISQVKPSQCLSTSALQGYSVTVVIVPRTYSLNVICSGTTTVLSTTTLPTNISFNSALTTTLNIRFSVLTGGVIGAGNVALSYPSIPGISPKTIIVTPAGGIE